MEEKHIEETAISLSKDLLDEEKKNELDSFKEDMMKIKITIK